MEYKFVAAMAVLYAPMALKAAEPREQLPNIVLVMADDLRYLDIGCYGSTNSITPNIDELSTQGTLFEQFYQTTAMSSPTRQSLMTGLHPVKNGAYPNHSYVRENIKSVAHYLNDLGYRVALHGKRHFAPASAYPYEFLGEQQSPFDEGLISEFLTSTKEDGRPFCLFICSHEPHSPWTLGDRSLFNPEELDLPEKLIDTPQTREAYRDYLAEVNELDRQVGRMIELLDEYEKEDNTLFVFTSEQGYSLPFAKWSCYDAGLHTAFIARYPGVIEAGRKVDVLCDYVDVLPTFIDFAGGDLSSYEFDGKSFKSVLLGGDDEHREYCYGVQTSRGSKLAPDHYGIRSISDKEWRYIRNLTPEVEYSCHTNSYDYFLSWEGSTNEEDVKTLMLYKYRPAEEFYNTANDPSELKNLIDDPALQPLIEEMRQELDRWMISQGDKGAQTEMEAKQRMTSALRKKKK